MFILTCLVICSSCPGHQTATIFLDNDKSYKNSSCNPSGRFPQMIMIPFFDKAFQVVPNCKTYPKHQTALAMMVYYHHWLEYFGDDDGSVKAALEKVMITWDTKKKIRKNGLRGYHLDGEPAGTSTIIGLTQTDSSIWVWEGYFHKISESSLMHELVHISLRAKYGHGDADHEGPKYYGWTPMHSAMILEAKETLRSFDI